MVARERLTRTSARNVLEGTIKRVVGDAEGAPQLDCLPKPVLGDLAEAGVGRRTAGSL